MFLVENKTGKLVQTVCLIDGMWSQYTPALSGHLSTKNL